MLRDSVFPIRDFSGGLVTKGSVLGLESKQTPNCINVHSSAFGPLQKRNGYSKVNSSTATGVANGLYNYRKNSTTQYLMGYFGNALKKMDVVSSAWDGTWDSVTFGTAMTSDLMHLATYSGAGVDSILLMTTESQDTPQSWTGSGNTADITNAPDGKYITFWQNMVIIGNIKTGTRPDRVQRSAIGSYTNWSEIGAGSDTVIEDCEDAWDEQVIGNVTASSADSCKVGLHSAQFTIASGFATGVIGSEVITTVSLTNYTKVKCWVSSTVALDAGDLQLLLDDTADCASPLETIDFPAIIANEWVEVTLTLANPATDIDIISIGLNMAVDKGALSIYIDDVHILGDEHPIGTGTGYDDIITPGDIGITGFGQLSGRLYVFKKYSVHRFTYLGGSPLIDVKQVKSSLGTKSPRTIVNVEVPGEGERIFFLSTDRQICQFDGYQALPVSEPIQTDNGYSSVYMNAINQSYLETCWAMVIPHRHWVVFFVPIGAATTPNYAIVYDYYAKSFWPYDTMPFLSGCISDNGAGVRLPYTQGTGYAYNYDSGNTDDTSAITASWESGKLDAGAIPVLKKARQAVVSLKAVGAYDLTFGYRTNWTTAWTSAPVMSQATNQHVRDIPKLFNLIQMKLSDSTSTTGFEVYGLDMIGDTRGVG